MALWHFTTTHGHPKATEPTTRRVRRGALALHHERPVPEGEGDPTRRYETASTAQPASPTLLVMPTQPDLTIRPLVGPDELPLFCELTYALDHELADDLAAGRRRPEWMWVALRDDRLVARLAWWGGASEPDYLDVLDVAADTDRVEIGVRLLTTATAQVIADGASRPEYLRFIPPDWRDDPAQRHVIEDRMAIAEATGARLLVERLRLEWRLGTAIAGPSERLIFQAVRSDAELVGLMAAVTTGTLDAHSRADLTTMSAHESAENQFAEELALYKSPREWWRIASLLSGDPVGFVIPARNDYNAIIAHIGVVPGHRGHGYIDELLAEGTRVLADLDVPRIRASTDVGNAPMANAFQRAGWVNFERAISMTWSSSIEQPT